MRGRLPLASIVLGALLIAVGIVLFVTDGSDDPVTTAAPSPVAVTTAPLPETTTETTTILSAPTTTGTTTTVTPPISTTSIPPTPPKPTPAPSAVPDPTLAPTTAPAETVAEFVAAFDAALAAGDMTFLLDRIHPIVNDLFGEDTCTAFVESQFPLASSITLIEVDSGPATRQIMIAGTEAAITDYYEGTTELIFDDEPFEVRAAWGLVGEVMHWLPTCA